MRGSSSKSPNILYSRNLKREDTIEDSFKKRIDLFSFKYDYDKDYLEEELNVLLEKSQDFLKLASFFDENHPLHKKVVNNYLAEVSSFLFDKRESLKINYKESLDLYFKINQYLPALEEKRQTIINFNMQRLAEENLLYFAEKEVANCIKYLQINAGHAYEVLVSSNADNSRVYYHLVKDNEPLCGDTSYVGNIQLNSLSWISCEKCLELYSANKDKVNKKDYSHLIPRSDKKYLGSELKDFVANKKVLSFADLKNNADSLMHKFIANELFIILEDSSLNTTNLKDNNENANRNDFSKAILAYLADKSEENKQAVQKLFDK